MEIPFLLDGVPGVFRRNSMTGRAELVVGGQRTVLASPYDPRTHFSVRTRTSWKADVNRRAIEVIKERPLVLGGMRQNRCTVIVDGTVVGQVTGT